MSELILPPHYRRPVQMAQPIVFWWNPSLQFIMCPASPIAPAPAGYQRIECRHAREVDKWSKRLGQQEKRIREMTDEERYNFEEPIRAQMLSELRKNLANATDQINKEFLAYSIKRIEAKREQRRKEVIETAMHCERKEGVAP